MIAAVGVLVLVAGVIAHHLAVRRLIDRWHALAPREWDRTFRPARRAFPFNRILKMRIVTHYLHAWQFSRPEWARGDRTAERLLKQVRYTPLLAVLGAMIVVLSTVILSGCVECKVDVLSSTRSPDSQLTAVEFFRDCEGATGAGSYDVSIIPASQPLPNDEGNVFICRPTTTADAKVQLRWRDDRHLDVIYKSGIEVFKRRATVRGVEIRFLALGSASTGIAPRS